MKSFDLDAVVPRLGQRAELVTSWYLCFNGYFPITSFILHDAGATKQPGGQITDADILAIRLPYTEEIIHGHVEPIYVKPDSQLDVGKDLTDFIIAEVSSQECKSPWISENDQTVAVEFLDYCLRRLGYWPPDAVPAISEKLSVEKCTFSDDAKRVRLRLLAFGSTRCDGLPGIQQITFETVFEFMRDLFGCYDPYSSEPTRKIVSDHKHWHPLICEVYRRLRGHKVEQSSPQEIVTWLFPDVGVPKRHD